MSIFFYCEGSCTRLLSDSSSYLADVVVAVCALAGGVHYFSSIYISIIDACGGWIGLDADTP